MDFSNESYVRIYTRDTTTWLRLGWDGQCVLVMVLRKLDMSGVLDIAGMEPWEVPVVHCRAPEESARAGMAACLRLGVLEHNGDCLVAPKFREAQEATKSDKQRQKESRERRRLVALSRPVTESNAIESQPVTENNGRSRPVTTGHERSPIAVQCDTDAVHGGAVPAVGVRDVASVFRKVTGHDLPTDIDIAWDDRTERKPARRMLEWCGGDMEKLRAKLLLLADDNWLPSQGIEQWAKRIGTNPSASKGPAPAPEENTYVRGGSFK